MTRRLLRDRKGAALVEFAIIAPVFLLVLVGAFDIAHNLYLRVALQGALQKSARDSTLEAGATSAAQQVIDDQVRSLVGGLTFGQDVDFTRRFYRTFERAAAKEKEPHDDLNDNDSCDNGESFVDVNANGVWDRDGGDAGQGFAFDRAIYTATVTYPRLFPLWRFIGGESTATVTAQTVLMNQPYLGQRNAPTPKPGTCNV